MFSKLKKATVSGRQWMLTAQFILSLLISGALSVWIITSLGSNVDQLVKIDLPAVKYSTLMDMEHEGISAAVYRSVYAAKAGQDDLAKSLKADVAKATSTILEHQKGLEQLEIDADLMAQIRATRPAVEAYVGAALAITEALAASDTRKADDLLVNFQKFFEETRTHLEAVQSGVQALSSRIEGAAVTLQTKAKVINIAITLASLLISLFLSFTIIRSLNRDLAQVVVGLRGQTERLSEVSQNFSTNASSLASTSTEQTAALQETAATLDEISAMMKRTEDNSKSLSESADQSQKAAEQGKGSIIEMTHSISSIQESFEQLSKQVNESNAQFKEVVNVIKNIGSKTKVINDIVFQTKLLSFNASVEAARAGEHGKGFAVVAQEIGNLASMSGNAAQEISEMLSTSVDRVESIVSQNRKQIEGLMSDGKQKVEQGTAVSRQTEASLEQIIEQSTAVNRMIADINASISEQARGIHEIVAAVSLLNNATTEISRASESGATGSKDLIAQTEALNEYMHQLEFLVSQTESASQELKPLDTPPTSNRASGGGSSSSGAANVIPMKAKAKAPASPPKRAEGKIAKSSKKNGTDGIEVHDYGTDVKIPLASDPRFEDV